MKIPNIEFSSYEELKAFQWKEMVEALEYVQSHSPYYKRQWKEANLTLDIITDWDDFTMLPFTTKSDLQKYNEEFIAVKKSAIVDWVTTSGTLGKPVSYGLTLNDLERLAYNESLSFSRMGVTKKDVVQITTALSKCFMAGIAYYEGAKRMGAGIVRTGPGSISAQWENIDRFSTTVLIAVPSFILKMLDYAKSNNLDPNKTTVKKILCIGQPLTGADFSPTKMTEEIKANWNVELFSTYASTEMSTAFTECRHGLGGHLNPELGYVEVVDERGNPVEENQEGEVVFTHFRQEGMPLVRFRTGDIAHIHSAQCACGSCSPRIGPILGRKDQLIKYKGTTIYPNEIIRVLNGRKDIGTFAIELHKDQHGNDIVKIRVDVNNDQKTELSEWLKERIRVTPEIIVDSHDHINRMIFPEGKRKINHVLDLRNT